MGRPFQQEIEAIGETYLFSKSINVYSLQKYIQDNIAFPFLVVGSGGSFSVALACALLIESLGGFAKATTPYELMNSFKGLFNCNVMLFSASGNNVDIINAYNFSKKNEARSTFILCLKESSKLVNEAIAKYNDNSFLEISLPHGKDGFLAVNSSLCALGIFENVFCSANSVDSSVSIDQPLGDDVLNCLTSAAIVALGGRWTMPTVYDLESKCIEAGLVNVMPADLRNFAHGRHHWIAKNPDTSVICFITADEQELAEKTLKLLPANVPKSIIVSSKRGISATIELLAQVFLIVQKLGKQRKIDPGKPGVPEYGSKLYHLRYSLLSELEGKNEYPNDILGRSALRKMRYNYLPESCFAELKDYAKVFLTRLSNTTFKGIVIDYDNTIIRQNNTKDETFLACINYIKLFVENGIYVCFATGRGKSIRNQLLDVIPRAMQERIYVCYYNGAYFRPLAAELSSTKDNIATALQQVYELIESEFKFYDLVVSLRNTNISIRGNAERLARLYNYLSRKILEGEINDIKLAKSDHSIDVMIASVSKGCAVNWLKQICGGEVLCMGDSGDELGNDYNLLKNEYALSVGTVSTSMSTCWNIASLGLRGPAATLEYFSKLKILKKGLRFSKSYLLG